MYIGKHLNISKIEQFEDTARLVVYFNDGTILVVEDYIRDMGFRINKKAYDAPIDGVNSFHFRFAPFPGDNSSAKIWNKYHENKGFEPYAYAWNGTEDSLFSNSFDYGCGQSLSVYCAKLIQLNGWNIPKNYPMKF